MSRRGLVGSPFTFTGELLDANALLYLRARYYSPALGVFTGLDPFEGGHDRPMSLNGYTWVEGNVVNKVDPSGRQGCDQEDGCGVIMPPPLGIIHTSDGGFVNLRQFEWTDTSWFGVRVTPSLNPITVVLPENYVPGTNIAKVVVFEPVYASLDVIYPSTMSPSAIGRFFGGQVLEIYDGSGQVVLWSTLFGEPLPEPNQATIPQPSVNPGAMTSPQSFQSQNQLLPQIGPYVDPVLEAIAHQECLETPDPSHKTCDPQKVWQWIQSNSPILETRSTNAFKYQKYYAGPGIYHVPTGTAGEYVNADGVRVFDCALLEAKYIGNPDDSPYVLGSSKRESPFSQSIFINPVGGRGVDFEEDDEFRRYGAALRAPESVNPFVKLEIITNETRSISYWQHWINKNNVPNASFAIRPWPPVIP